MRITPVKSLFKARQLFARALDTPGGLKIQTIHAFCEALLHQFPLEANVPGHFLTLQGLEQIMLLDAARTYVLAGESSGGIEQHYEALVPHASDFTIEKGLRAIIDMRKEFLNWIEAGVDAAIADLYLILDVSPSESDSDIIVNAVNSLPISHEDMLQIASLAIGGTESTDQPMADALLRFTKAGDAEQKFEILQKGPFYSKRNTAKKADNQDG